SLPIELKDLSSKFNELTEEIKGLKIQFHELEIKLPKELKEIPTKLEDFTKTATSLTSQVAKLKILQWELPKELISLPAKVESTQAKLKTLDALLSLLLNVTKSLNKFAEVLESTSTKARAQRLEIVLTQPTTEKGASSTAIHGDKEEASTTIHGDKEEASTAIHGDKEEAFSTIKLKDLTKLVFKYNQDSRTWIHQKMILSSLLMKVMKMSQMLKLKTLQSLDPHLLEIKGLKIQFHELEIKLPKELKEIPTKLEDFTKTATSLTSQVAKLKILHSLPIELKDLSSKFNELTEEIKGLKIQVHELEIELPKELKEIPTKLEDFTKTATSLTSQVAKLKILQWELPKELISLPAKVESTQAKLKTLDALLSLLLNVTKSLNKFAEVLESTSTKARAQSVPSTGQAGTIPAGGRKTQTKQLPPSFSKEDLIRLLKLQKKI
nr:hypothetical protein [Tanacetum cinerariifolium]